MEISCDKIEGFCWNLECYYEYWSNYRILIEECLEKIYNKLRKKITKNQKIKLRVKKINVPFVLLNLRKVRK